MFSQGRNQKSSKNHSTPWSNFDDGETIASIANFDNNIILLICCIQQRSRLSTCINAIKVIWLREKIIEIIDFIRTILLNFIPIQFETTEHKVFCRASPQRVDWKCWTWKWRTIKIAGHEIAGHENAGHENAGHEDDVRLTKNDVRAWNCGRKK